MVTYPRYKVAAAHLAPVYLDLQATVDKTCAAIHEAAANGAELVVFPETHLPGFPVWCSLRAPIHNHEFFRTLAANAPQVDGPEIAAIADATRQSEVFVSLGFNERSPISDGCLWNANLLIGDRGEILCHHRKIVPTFYEKLVWAAGDGAGLQVCDTRLGKLGMLICGENTNPLARFTMLAQGEQVHCSSYPPVWPAHDPNSSEGYDLERAILLRASAHSFEGKVYNVVASGYLDRATKTRLTDCGSEAERILEGSPPGISVVIGPDGNPISEIKKDEEGLLYADIDLSRCVEPKQIHDVVGGYNRFDIFELKVNRAANRPISFEPRTNASCDSGNNEAGVES